jgi:hypothetical protein
MLCVFTHTRAHKVPVIGSHTPVTQEVPNGSQRVTAGTGHKTGIGNYIIQPLACIINQSFQEGKFPEILKLSLFTPVFKKGERENPENYHPISITTPISKILEKAFLARLEKHFVKNKIFE